MQSIENIYRLYADKIFYYLLSLTKKRDIAEELTQETFYQAVRSIDRFKGESSVSTWLIGIAKNVFKRYTAKHPHLEDIDEQIIEVKSVETDVLSNIGYVEIVKKLHCLKEPLREVFYLRFFAGLSYKEIGEVFGKSENWACVNYFRGKEQIRKEMNEHAETIL